MSWSLDPCPYGFVNKRGCPPHTFSFVLCLGTPGHRVTKVHPGVPVPPNSIRVSFSPGSIPVSQCPQAPYVPRLHPSQRPLGPHVQQHSSVSVPVSPRSIPRSLSQQQGSPSVPMSQAPWVPSLHPNVPLVPMSSSTAPLVSLCPQGPSQDPCVPAAQLPQCLSPCPRALSQALFQRPCVPKLHPRVPLSRSSIPGSPCSRAFPSMGACPILSPPNQRRGRG